ncbi:MAG: non-heme iron oxygenase ferredoxin subunit [Gemmatimonadales bacterium]
MKDDGFELVASVDDLEEGIPLGVECGGDVRICLIQVNGETYAISDQCTHAEFPMSGGEMVDDYVIECGLHGAQFDIRDGSALELPATEPIGCYEVKQEDGGVWIRLRSV